MAAYGTVIDSNAPPRPTRIPSCQCRKEPSVVPQVDRHRRIPSRYRVRVGGALRSLRFHFWCCLRVLAVRVHAACSVTSQASRRSALRVTVRLPRILGLTLTQNSTVAVATVVRSSQVWASGWRLVERSPRSMVKSTWAAARPAISTSRRIQRSPSRLVTRIM